MKTGQVDDGEAEILDARPRRASRRAAISDRINQPTVSSTTPADRMTRPMLRLVRSRSIRILAITGIAEIDIAVARNRLNRIRLLGSAR